MLERSPPPRASPARLGANMVPPPLAFELAGASISRMSTGFVILPDRTTITGLLFRRAFRKQADTQIEADMWQRMGTRGYPLTISRMRTAAGTKFAGTEIISWGGALRRLGLGISDLRNL